MSILKKPYEIAVYDDVPVDGVFVEKRLGIIGKDTMTSQCRVIEPNLIRSTNGQNKFSFKMYKKYIDTITGEEVDNPFVDWLVSERKIKLYYKDKWYDFIVKDINENSSNYLYTYQLDDANVQELSKNGFGVTLDAELMNNIGTATQLGAQVIEETDWTVDGDVAVQTVSEALIYVQMPSNLSNYEIYHLSDQVAPYTSGVGKTLLTNSTTPKLSDLAGKTILAFYSSCKNKPHRFQFIYSSKGYNKLDDEKYVHALDRKDDRTIIEKDCQYYIDFNTPETDYSVHNSNYDLYLPTGFSVVEQGTSSGDTTISSWYRGARYGYAHQSVYVPLLERYCQKFIKDEPVSLYSSGNNKNIELYQDGSDGGIDGTFNLTSGKVTGFTTGEAKNSPWSGIKLALDYSILDTFEVSYKLTRTDGVLKTIGGHNASFDTQFSVYSDAARTNKLGYTTDSLINLTGNPGTIYVTAYYTKKRTTQADSTPFIFIQPNRSLTDGVKFVISELSVKRKGDYLGYTTSEFVSPTLVQNCITDYKFESGSGWTATASATTSSADKAKVGNVYGRFVSSKFVSIVDDFLAGTYNESNTYTPYMKLSFKNANQFILNSGIYDNRTMIQNMPQNEEWVLDYEIVNSSGQSSSDNFRFSLGEYLYNTSTGLYNQRTGFINFTGSNATTHGTGKRIVFTVNSSTYDVDSFKKNSRIYLKIEPTSVGTSTDADGNIIPTEYYIKKIALYKKSLGADGQIIYPDYEEEQSAAAEEWVENGTLEKRYIYFNSWHVNSDNPDAYMEKDRLPTITKTTLDYSIYKPVYNEGAEKVRTVTVKESNYFNILQSIAETFEQWMIIDVERNADGSIRANGKKIHFRNYRNSDNHACFRYGVNLKDIQRTTSSKNIVTKLIVKQNANELAENGFCTIQRAGANPTGENYIYDFQYHQNTGIMPADEYLTTNYYLTGAEGPDGELWSSGVTTKSTYNLKGYFPRLKKINDSIVPINDEIIALQADLVKRRAEKEVADSIYEAAVSGIEEVREDFLTLTGVYPEEAQNGEIQSIVINGATSQEDWAVIDTGKTGYTNGIKVENQTAYIALKVSTDEYIEEVPCEIQGADNTDVVNLTANAKKITTSDPNGGLRIVTNWDEPSGGFWRTYTLTYELELLDGELKNIGCSAGRYSGFTIKVTNAQGQEAGSYDYAYRSIYSMNSPQKNTKYLVTIRGDRSSTNTKLTPDLWIQPNRGLSDNVTCRISNIKLSKLLTSEEVDSSRAASRERKVDVYIDATITLDGGRTVNRILETTCVFQPSQIEAVASQPIAVIDTSRSDVQKYLTEYTTYFEKKESSTLEKNTLQPIITNKENSIKNKEARRKQLLGYKKELNKLFFNRYFRFIQEGTWINEEYVDDEKYFADAQSVLYNSCYPQVGYGINVLELSAMPGYEMFSFEPGEKTWAIDPEFFGENYKEEVIITELSEMLDDPSKNSVKVQNFKNQFQDLFQKITATVQQTQYNVGSYEKGAALVEATAEQKSEFITSAINEAQLYLNAGQTVKSGSDGITITDDSNAKRQLRLVGGAILFSTEDPNTKETKWRTGITNEGIAADLIKAGKLNTAEIQIMAGNDPVFRWDAYGISAYDALWSTTGSVSTVSDINSTKFVRFDKNGIYGIDGQVNGQTWHPTGVGYNNDPLQEIDALSTFALTWKGLKVTGSNNTEALIGKQGNYIIKVNNGSGDTFRVKTDGTVEIAGDLIVGGTLDSQDRTTLQQYVSSQFDVNTNDFSWKFDKDNGMMMWSGAQPDSFDDYDMSTDDNLMFRIYKDEDDNGKLWMGGNAEFTGTIVGSTFKNENETLYLSTTPLSTAQTIGSQSVNNVVFKIGSNFGINSNGEGYFSGGNIAGWVFMENGWSGGFTRQGRNNIGQDDDKAIYRYQQTTLTPNSLSFTSYTDNSYNIINSSLAVGFGSITDYSQHPILHFTSQSRNDWSWLYSQITDGGAIIYSGINTDQTETTTGILFNVAPLYVIGEYDRPEKNGIMVGAIQMLGPVFLSGLGYELAAQAYYEEDGTWKSCSITGEMDKPSLQEAIRDIDLRLREADLRLGNVDTRLTNLGFKGPFDIRLGGQIVGKIFQFGKIVYGFLLENQEISGHATTFEFSGSVPPPIDRQVINWLAYVAGSSLQFAFEVVLDSSQTGGFMQLNTNSDGVTVSAANGITSHWTYFCYSTEESYHPKI